MANKGKSREERKKTMVRVVSLSLAGLMIFSVVAAAIFSQVY